MENDINTQRQQERAGIARAGSVSKNQKSPSRLKIMTRIKNFIIESFFGSLINSIAKKLSNRVIISRTAEAKDIKGGRHLIAQNNKNLGFVRLSTEEMKEPGKYGIREHAFFTSFVDVERESEASSSNSDRSDAVKLLTKNYTGTLKDIKSIDTSCVYAKPGSKKNTGSFMQCRDLNTKKVPLNASNIKKQMLELTKDTIGHEGRKNLLLPTKDDFNRFNKSSDLTYEYFVRNFIEATNENSKTEGAKINIILPDITDPKVDSYEEINSAIDDFNSKDKINTDFIEIAPNVKVYSGDICFPDRNGLNSTVIVNAANIKLKSGSGVCGSIFKAFGGRGKMQKECFAIRKTLPNNMLEVGKSIITKAYHESSEVTNVIHTPAPNLKVGQYANGSAEEKKKIDEDLYNSYLSAMDLAYSQDHKEISFPLLGTGIYNVPIERSLLAYIEACKDFVSEYPEFKSNLIIYKPSAKMLNYIKDVAENNSENKD